MAEPELNVDSLIQRLLEGNICILIFSIYLNTSVIPGNMG